jgi:hypothetical protein
MLIKKEQGARSQAQSPGKKKERPGQGSHTLISPVTISAKMLKEISRTISIAKKETVYYDQVAAILGIAQVHIRLPIDVIYHHNHHLNKRTSHFRKTHHRLQTKG